MGISKREHIRRGLIKAHPEWKGKIWFSKWFVTVRGIGSVSLGAGDANYLAIDDYLFYFHDLMEHADDNKHAMV